jgi:hypothetical protein
MNSILQKKLESYELPPPPGAWDNIAAALDEGNGLLSEKFLQFAPSPPAGSWEKIKKNWTRKNRLPGRSPGKKFLYPLVAVAALVVVLLFLGIFRTGTTEKINSPGNNIVQTNIPSSSDKDPGNNIQPEQYNTGIPKKTSSLSYAASTAISRSRFGSVGTATMNLVDHLFPSIALRKSAIEFHHNLDNYMIYSDDNGTPCGLPKKLFDAFTCPGEDYACQERIRTLQERVAGSAFATDFSGVLEMVSNLKENQ